jgi:hypothetical protein
LAAADSYRSSCRKASTGLSIDPTRVNALGVSFQRQLSGARSKSVNRDQMWHASNVASCSGTIPSLSDETSLRWIRRTGKKSISLIAVPPSFLFVNYVLVVCPSFSFFPYSYLSITYIAQNREYPHITSQTSSRDDKQAKNRRSFRVQSREIDFGGIERAGKGA